MSFKRLNGLSGFDMSVPEYEIRDQIKEKESAICSYFTDDFKTNFTTPLGPDAKIHIKPLETKVSITVMFQYGDFDFTASTFTYLQWKWVVMDSLLTIIKNSYGDRPYKEAMEVISKVMNPDNPAMKSPRVTSLTFWGPKSSLTDKIPMSGLLSDMVAAIQRAHGEEQPTRQIQAFYGREVKSKPEDSNDTPLMEIRDSNISKKNLYTLLNKALETPFSIPFARKDIKVNGPFPLSACKKDDPKYISIRLANGSLTYVGLSIKGTKKDPSYIFTF